ncbi:MAG: 2-oxoacid:ferredoxin oxidoreductase subunit beta [Theionarchaea archaeon]|nr:MAG: 2-oxoglutarate synthase [Theionarchaea archaeon DG-70]MBU7011062.1 2-oxoacid:ferredoxin oxidoreductase subunit beta [Theionarchaea archaeon]
MYMTTDTLELREKYLRSAMFPTIFCTGCGIGNVLHYTIQAIDNVGLDITQTIFVSGIGCSSRLPGYVKADGLHTTHGRALAFATGIHAANPNLHIIVFTGDGDCVGIGGNHFIHAIRRNIDVTVIAVNNFTYGMTGGQVAPTTPRHAYTTTTPYGNVEHPFDMSVLAKAAGAPYVARWSVTHPYQPIKSIEKGLKRKGFAFIEILSPCPTAYGRYNKLRDIEEMWKWYRENVILIEEYNRIMEYGTEEEKEAVQEKITIGEFVDIEKPEFMDEWKLLVERTRK